MAFHRSLLGSPFSWRRRKLASSVLSVELTALLVACGAPPPRPTSPVNAAAEVAREVDDADPYAPAEEPRPPDEPSPPSEPGD